MSNKRIEKKKIQCPKCHSEIPSNSLFCNICGLKIEENTQYPHKFTQSTDKSIQNSSGFDIKKHQWKVLMTLLFVLAIVRINNYSDTSIQMKINDEQDSSNSNTEIESNNSIIDSEPEQEPEPEQEQEAMSQPLPPPILTKIADFAISNVRADEDGSYRASFTNNGTQTAYEIYIRCSNTGKEWYKDNVYSGYGINVFGYDEDLDYIGERFVGEPLPYGYKIRWSYYDENGTILNKYRDFYLDVIIEPN